jgi:hypothetical protein
LVIAFSAQISQRFPPIHYHLTFKGKKELNVSLFQGVVLLLFNSGDNLSYSFIKNATNLGTSLLIHLISRGQRNRTNPPIPSLWKIPRPNKILQRQRNPQNRSLLHKLTIHIPPLPSKNKPNPTQRNATRTK